MMKIVTAQFVGRKYNIPIMITLVRLIIIPFLSNAIFLQQWYTILFLFIGAAISDFADGFFARLFKQETVLGAFLDPLADKLLLISSYVAFAKNNLISFFSSSFLIWVIVREIVLMSGALYIIFFLQRRLYPSYWGKIAMFMQLFFLILLSTTQCLKIENVFYLGSIFLLMETTLVISLFHYIFLFFNGKH